MYCGQTVSWIRMPLGMEVGLGPSDIVLDGDPALPTQRGTAALPNFFLAHVCGQTAEWIRMPCGMLIGLYALLGEGIFSACHTNPNPTLKSCICDGSKSPSIESLACTRNSSTSTCRCTLNILGCLMARNVCSNCKCTYHFLIRCFPVL